MERVSSIFSQILKFFPRSVFDAAVAHHHGEKHAKGMTCWSQLVALLFCHLGGARSLREIIGGLAASEGKLRHLGIDRAPTRSTLAYANEHFGTNSAIVELHLNRATVLHPHQVFLNEHREYGHSMYDLHSDGSGVYWRLPSRWTWILSCSRGASRCSGSRAREFLSRLKLPPR